MKLYCSKCGSTLKVESVADFSNPNEVELRVIVRPCSECASQQSVQRMGYQTAIIPCPHCGVNVTIDSDSFIAHR